MIIFECIVGNTYDVECSFTDFLVPVYSLFVPRNERMHKIRLLALMYANNEIDVRFTFMTASFYCASKCN